MDKLTIAGKREFSFNSKRDGKLIEGVMYLAYDEQNTPLEFSSQDYEKQVHRVRQYDPKLAIEVELAPRLSDGKIKYSEVFIPR